MAGNGVFLAMLENARYRQREYTEAAAWFHVRVGKLKDAVRKLDVIVDYPVVFHADMQYVHMVKILNLQKELVKAIEEASKLKDLLED